MGGVSFNIWAILILAGAAQGIFLSLYLFTKRENRAANTWLGLLLTTISLHLLEYGADISGISLRYTFIIASTYPLVFCFGPLYYLYCRSLLEKKSYTGVKIIIHFIPSALLLLLMLPFYGLSAAEKVSFMQNVGVTGKLVIPTEQLVFMAAHVTQTVIYLCAAFRFIAKKKEAFKHFSSDVLVEKKISWLNGFSLYLAVYLALNLLLVLLLTFVHSYQVQIDYVMLLITSLSLYVIGYSALRTPEIFKSLPERAVLPPVSRPITPPSELATDRRLWGQKEKLIQFMETNKPYLKSDLKISELADALSVPQHLLSQLINDEFMVNFYDFINQYRVEHAKKLLVEDSRNFKILAIAYEAGFNSKATFNRVFKKLTDYTPSEYKEKFSPSVADDPS